MHGEANLILRKKVKRQSRTIIVAILADILSSMTCAKIRPQGLFSSGEKFFKGFYHMWAWQPPWSMDRDHFSNLSSPQPKEAPHKILSNTGPAASEEKSFEILNIFLIQMYGAHINA